jgi:hypothetical protein
LAEKGLLLSIGNGVYGLTDEGGAYLDGEYNAEEGAYIETNEENGSSAFEKGDS